MDVDLLRPGTVPISADTILRFEFLIDHKLLLQHLQKPNPDPSAIELITKFSELLADTLNIQTVLLNPANGETVNLDLKIIAVKVLSLKIAAFIKWNLLQIRSLPFKIQFNLIQDLLYCTNNNTVINIPIGEEHLGTPNSPQQLFALLVYHRWMLNVTMHRITTNWQIRIGSNDISLNEESIICTLENVNNTVVFLTESLNWETIPDMLTFDCFKLSATKIDIIDLDWSSSKPITKQELCAQIHYDLGTFFFYKEDYKLATEHFMKCNELYRVLEIKSGFVSIDSDILNGYIKACCGPFDAFNLSIVNHYMGITGILQKDNINRTIPLLYRINLELDIQGALSSGTFTVARDLFPQIRALNLVRCILDGKSTHLYITLFENIDVIMWAIDVSWSGFSTKDKKLLKIFLMEMVFKNQIPDLDYFKICIQSKAMLSGIFDKADLHYMEKNHSEVQIPESVNTIDFSILDFTKKRVPKMELKQLEQTLISTYDHSVVREVLGKISTGFKNSGFSVKKVNPQWELPIPLQSVVQSLTRGFLQDYAFLLLAKSREQMLNKNWNQALELLITLDKELAMANGNVAKLSQMVKWEVLLVQIAQLLQEWPKATIDKETLANACEACLQSTETLLPRTEVAEQCILCLLNLERWEFLVSLDKRRTSGEISSAIALNCQEMNKTKGIKKFSKNFWDLVVPIFTTTNSQPKRGSYGQTAYQDPNATLRANILLVFSQLRANFPLTVIISMLTRIYNILRDESTVELQAEHLMLWPATLSSAMSYNTKSVCEILLQIVTQALRYYPNNVSWLRLLGDINFSNGHYKTALKHYLESLLLLTDYFNLPVRNDDHVFRRMIKCCSALGCHTQAAVLCQFLDEPDYVLAFRILGEQKIGNDAVDAYYHCFWDTNILEYLVHVHNKKGEYQRRRSAIQVMGLLELNSSNNEEIQREASNLRKSIFLRALCKQYVF